MNQINVIGNLASDVELRKAGEHDVATFLLAGGRSRSKDEAKRGKAEVFINVECWNGLSNVAGKLSKGEKVGVTGRLVSDRYEKDGQTRTAFRINADQITFVGQGGGGAPDPERTLPGQEDDIPF